MILGDDSYATKQTPSDSGMQAEDRRVLSILESSTAKEEGHYSIVVEKRTKFAQQSRYGCFASPVDLTRGHLGFKTKIVFSTVVCRGECVHRHLHC